MGEHNVWVNIKEKSWDWIYLTDLIWTTSGWCHAGSVWYFNSLTQGMYKHVPIWQRSLETDHHRSYVGSGSPKTDVDKRYYHLSPVFLFPSLQVLLLLSESTTWQQGFLKNNKTKKITIAQEPTHDLISATFLWRRTIRELSRGRKRLSCCNQRVNQQSGKRAMSPDIKRLTDSFP